jgi:hypothetical protein
MHMVKKIFLNIAFIILVVAILDFAIGKTLRHFYFTEKSGLHYRTTYSMDSTKAEILVFGSSRANHHYVPDIYEDSLHMSFYNTGRDGSSMLYNLAVFKSILKRYTPKIIIFDLVPKSLYYNAVNYERLSSLQPYYSDHPEVKDIVQLRGPYEKYKLFSSIYPFNSGLLAIIMGNLEINKKRKGDQKGYVPLLNCIKDTSLISLVDSTDNFDTTHVQALNYIARICKLKNILLLFVNSPIYANIPTPASAEVFSRIADEYNAVFLSYLNDSLFLKSPSLFNDRGHLNDKGAKIFSTMLVHQIKSIESNGKAGIWHIKSKQPLAIYNSN